MNRQLLTAARCLATRDVIDDPAIVQECIDKGCIYSGDKDCRKKFAYDAAAAIMELEHNAYVPTAELVARADNCVLANKPGGYEHCIQCPYHKEYGNTEELCVNMVLEPLMMRLNEYLALYGELDGDDACE